MLVLAGPGSGKTTVIIERILHLITKKQVQPQSILAISFSKASAEELDIRFQRKIRELAKTKGYESKPSEVTFATFHSIFFRILKETYHYTYRDIIRQEEKIRILTSLLMNFPLSKEEITGEIKEEILSKISYYKNRGIQELKKKESPAFENLFHQYNDTMHKAHKLDFDDMGLLCLKLLQSRPDVLSHWQQRYSYFFIDEFQDINEIQFQNVQLLAGEKANLFVVGDDDQAIYSFRGASPKYMLQFDSYYPNAKKVLLDINFRCSGNIVKQSRKMIAQNTMRYQKDIQAFHEDKEPVNIQSFESRKEEYLYMESRIRDLVDHHQASYSDFACIFRTNQDMRELSQFLSQQRIPFLMKEQTASIFRHFIALDILAYLSFFLDGYQRKDFVVIMNKPVRYFSRSACIHERICWKELKYFYRTKTYMLEKIEELEKHDRWIQKLDLYGAIYYIRKIVGYEAYLKEYCKTRGILWQEAEEVLNAIHESTQGMGSLSQWKEYMKEYEEALQNAKIQKEGVQLLTMHACKGLEFPYVFIPDCNEGKIPHKKASEKEEIEEERRMFYVAMTRARQRLEILYPEDKERRQLPCSRFLEVMKNDKIPAGRKALRI